VTRNVVSSVELRKAFSAYPTGIAIVAALADGAPVGLVVGSFTSVSLDPPLASFCVGKTSRTWPALAQAGAVGVSVLGEDQEEICRAMAGARESRFETVCWQATPGGAVTLHGAAATFACQIENRIDAGDHEIVVLYIDEFVGSARLPLVFHGSAFRRLAR
jgi:flavin reductase (DIM6/NTAB) family NADH-FMN oxidoreductase RutF